MKYYIKKEFIFILFHACSFAFYLHLSVNSFCFTFLFLLFSSSSKRVDFFLLLFLSFRIVTSSFQFCFLSKCTCVSFSVFRFYWILLHKFFRWKFVSVKCDVDKWDMVCEGVKKRCRKRNEHFLFWLWCFFSSSKFCLNACECFFVTV